MSYGSDVQMPKAYPLQRLERALRNVKLAQNDPATASKLLPSIQADLEVADAGFLDPRGASEIVIVPGLQPIVMGAGPAPFIAPAASLRWTEDGTVLGMRLANSLGTDAGNAVLALKITTKDGKVNLFNDGQHEAFVPFILINQISSPWYPMAIEVRHNERWDIGTEGLVAGAGTILPFIAFAFIAKDSTG
jgi:hypothetical protein